VPRRATDNPNWGGRRPNVGRLQRNINLSPESARELAILVKQRHNPATEKQIVEELIHAAWLEVDQSYIQASDAAPG